MVCGRCEMIDYDEYVRNKKLEQPASGFVVDESAINPMLFDYQRVITRWALHRGKAALFEDCGLGKGIQEWEWSKHVARHTDMPVLILAPLSVAEQMVDEAPQFGYSINLCKSNADLRPGLNVSNYEKLHKFKADDLGGIVPDESSCLKAGTFGKLSTDLVAFAESIPYRLAATATPAPNDLIEIAFHAEFLGIMQESEVKALFFTQDGNSSNKFRLKRNAVEAFYKWLATWSVALRKPSDLGFSDDGFELPELRIHQIVIDDDEPFSDGTLFTGMKSAGIDDRRKNRKSSIELRAEAVAQQVNASDKQWLVWCDLNPESTALAKAINDSVEVAGSHKDQHKTDAMIGFKHGEIKVIVSKPQIFGFGLNFQNSHMAAFCGLGDSFERYYQTIKRQHRFGQLSPFVDVYVFTTPKDGAVVSNIRRKWAQNDIMFDELVKHMAVHSDLTVANGRQEMEYNPQQAISLPGWLAPVTAKRLTRAEDDVMNMTHIDLDAIPFQIDGEIKFYWDGSKLLNPSVSMIVPRWVSTTLCNP